MVKSAWEIGFYAGGAVMIKMCIVEVLTKDGVLVGEKK